MDFDPYKLLIAPLFLLDIYHLTFRVIFSSMFYFPQYTSCSLPFKIISKRIYRVQPKGSTDLPPASMGPYRG